MGETHLHTTIMRVAVFPEAVRILQKYVPRGYADVFHATRCLPAGNVPPVKVATLRPSTECMLSCTSAASGREKGIHVFPLHGWG